MMRANAAYFALIAAATVGAGTVHAGALPAQTVREAGDAGPPACEPAMAALAERPDAVEPSEEVAPPDATVPAVLNALVGQWNGAGALFGRDTRFAMQWEPTLDGRFLELRYRFEGPVSMKARAYYLLGGGGELRGTWIDTRGEFFDLAAMATDSSLATEWTSSGETGRTIYRLVGPGAIEVCDFVRVDDGWRPFGAARYARDD